MNNRDAGTRMGGIYTEGGSITGHNIIGGNNTEFVGGNKILSEQLTPERIDNLFRPLADLLPSTPAGAQPAAAEKVEQLKTEVAKGNNANDSVMAKLIEGVVGLVPSAVSGIASIFATPVLSGLAGPATKYVLDKIQGK